MRWKRNKERRPRLLPWDLRLLLAVLIVALLGTICFGVYQRQALSADLERLRIAGKPLSLDEFYAQDHPSPEAIEAGNAVYEALDAHVPLADYRTPGGLWILGRSDEDLPKDQPYENELKEALGNHLAENRQALLLLELASEHEDAYLHRQDVVETEEERGAMSRMCALSRTLCAGACLCAEDGEPMAATRVLKIVFRASRIFTRYPDDVFSLGWLSCYSQASRALTRGLSRATFTETQLRELQTAAWLEHGARAATRSVDWERCDIIAWFLRPQESKHYRLEHGDDSGGLDFADGMERICDRLTGLPQLRLRQYLVFAEECEKALASTLEYAMAQRKTLAEMRKERGDLSWLTHLIAECVDNWPYRVALVRTTVTGIAVERYRLRHGSLPDSLESLVPEFLETLPIDPYTGTALRYERLEPGYKISSVYDRWVDGRLMTGSPIDFEVLR